MDTGNQVVRSTRQPFLIGRLLLCPGKRKFHIVAKQMPLYVYNVCFCSIKKTYPIPLFWQCFKIPEVPIMTKTGVRYKKTAEMIGNAQRFHSCFFSSPDVFLYRTVSMPRKDRMGMGICFNFIHVLLSSFPLLKIPYIHAADG